MARVHHKAFAAVVEVRIHHPHRQRGIVGAAALRQRFRKAVLLWVGIVVEQQPFGRVLLAMLAVGLGGYALWRLFRAALGHGPEGADRGLDRLGSLGSGIAYAAMCAIAVQILTGPGASGNTKKTARDVFAWPAGRWLIALAGLVLAGVAIYQFIRGVRQKFLDDSKTEEIPDAMMPWFKALGTIPGGGLAWREIEVVADEAGGPSISLHGRMKALAEERGVRKIHCSLSHTAAMVMAYVIIET